MPKPILTSVDIEVFTLTGDGIDDFWYIEKNPGLTLHTVNHRGANANVSSVRELESALSFYGVISEANNKLLALTANDQGVNVNEIAIAGGVTSDMEAPTLTNGNVNDIAGWYDPIEFTEKLGALRMLKRFIELAHTTWAIGRDSYIYLGIEGKANQSEVQPEITYLVNNAVITAADETQFWIDWNNQVGN